MNDYKPSCFGLCRPGQLLVLFPNETGVLCLQDGDPSMIFTNKLTDTILEMFGDE